MKLDSAAWWKLPTSIASSVETNVVNSCAVGRVMACNLIKCCTLFGIIAITGSEISNNVHFFNFNIRPFGLGHAMNFILEVFVQMNR